MGARVDGRGDITDGVFMDDTARTAIDYDDWVDDPGRAESRLERRTWGKGTYVLVAVMALVIIGQAIALGSR